MITDKVLARLNLETASMSLNLFEKQYKYMRFVVGNLYRGAQFGLKNIINDILG